MCVFIPAGVSLNFLNFDPLADSLGSVSRISNSAIYGSTATADCSASLQCHAMTAGDVFGSGCNSVFGPSWRHVGIVASQYTNKGKLCTSDIAGVGGALDVCRPPSTPDVM